MGEWHRDPTGRHEWRLWENGAWTSSVADGGVEHVGTHPVRVYGHQTRQRTSGLAVAALVTAVAGLILGGLPALPAPILGALALREINASNGTVTGRGMALAGVVVGGLVWLTFVGFALLVLWALASAAQMA